MKRHPLERIVRLLACKLTGHRYAVAREFGGARKVTCSRCGVAWAMHDATRSFLPWDADFEQLYAPGGVLRLALAGLVDFWHEHGHHGDMHEAVSKAALALEQYLRLHPQDNLARKSYATLGACSWGHQYAIMPPCNQHILYNATEIKYHGHRNRKL